MTTKPESNSNRDICDVHRAVQATVYSSVKKSHHYRTTRGFTIDPSEIELYFETESGYPIKFYDDGRGCLWIFRDTLGIRGIVRANSESDAYNIINDEILTPLTDEEFEELKRDNPEFTEENGEIPEGYEYQSSMTPDTCGIVAHDLTGETLELLSTAEMSRLGIKMSIVL